MSWLSGPHTPHRKIPHILLSCLRSSPCPMPSFFWVRFLPASSFLYSYPRLFSVELTFCFFCPEALQLHVQTMNLKKNHLIRYLRGNLCSEKLMFWTLLMQERKHHGIFSSDFFWCLWKEFYLNCVGHVLNHRLDLEKMNSTSSNTRLYFQKFFLAHFLCMCFSKPHGHVRGKGLICWEWNGCKLVLACVSPPFLLSSLPSNFGWAVIGLILYGWP